MMMMGNDGWMIDDVFLVLQCFMPPESSTLICQNGTRRESGMCIRVTYISHILLYV